MSYSFTLGDLRKRLNEIPEEKNDLQVFFCNTASGVYDLVDGGGVVEKCDPSSEMTDMEEGCEYVVLYSS